MRARADVSAPSFATPESMAAASDEWEALQSAIVQASTRNETAPCSEDPELWWSTAPDAVVEAVQACVWCPVRSQCLVYALASRESYGVWGGLTPAERNELMTGDL